MTELIKSLNSSLSFGQEAVTFCLPWAGHCLLVFSNQWFSNQITCLVSKGWCSGQTARLPPMWPGFKSRRRRHMWVEFVVGFLLCSERFFFGYSGFPLSSKPNISKFQFDQESVRRRTFDKEFFKLIKNSIFYKSIYSVCVKWSWRTKESFKVRSKAWFILMKRD